MTQTTHVSNQCATIIADAINAESQVLHPTVEETDPDDSGSQKQSHCMVILIFFFFNMTLKREFHISFCSLINKKGLQEPES